MTSTTVAVALIVAGILISLAMILYFLWSVYEGGGPKHVLDVAKALREVYDPSWPTKLLRFLPTANDDQDDDGDGEDEDVQKSA
jgi:hypothetical protein